MRVQPRLAGFGLARKPQHLASIDVGFAQPLVCKIEFHAYSSARRRGHAALRQHQRGVDFPCVNPLRLPVALAVGPAHPKQQPSPRAHAQPVGLWRIGQRRFQDVAMPSFAADGQLAAARGRLERHWQHWCGASGRRGLWTFGRRGRACC